MSHDLHQPLQAIKILLDLLKEESTTLFQYKLLNQVENSVTYLNTGLDKLLKTLDSGRGPKYGD
jgi:K+-sensing histidine kinase KdpD